MEGQLLTAAYVFEAMEPAHLRLVASFHTQAQGWLEVSRLAKAESHLSTQALFTLARALELASKSYLRSRGMTEKDFRSKNGVGHSLTRAMTLVEEQGGADLVADLKDAQDQLTSLSDDYESTFLGYGSVESWWVPDPADVEAAAERTVDRIGSAIREIGKVAGQGA